MRTMFNARYACLFYVCSLTLAQKQLQEQTAMWGKCRHVSYVGAAARQQHQHGMFMVTSAGRGCLAPVPRSAPLLSALLSIVDFMILLQRTRMQKEICSDIATLGSLLINTIKWLSCSDLQQSGPLRPNVP